MQSACAAALRKSLQLGIAAAAHTSAPHTCITLLVRTPLHRTVHHAIQQLGIAAAAHASARHTRITLQAAQANASSASCHCMLGELRAGSLCISLQLMRCARLYNCHAGAAYALRKQLLLLLHVSSKSWRPARTLAVPSKTVALCKRLRLPCWGSVCTLKCAATVACRSCKLCSCALIYGPPAAAVLRTALQSAHL